MFVGVGTPEETCVVACSLLTRDAGVQANLSLSSFSVDECFLSGERPVPSPSEFSLLRDQSASNGECLKYLDELRPQRDERLQEQKSPTLPSVWVQSKDTVDPKVYVHLIQCWFQVMSFFRFSLVSFDFSTFVLRTSVSATCGNSQTSSMAKEERHVSGEFRKEPLLWCSDTVPFLFPLSFSSGPCSLSASPLVSSQLPSWQQSSYIQEETRLPCVLSVSLHVRLTSTLLAFGWDGRA